MTETWLSPADVAERAPVSRKAIIGAIKRGELRASWRCRRWWIAESDLEAWIAAGERADEAPVLSLRPRSRRRGGTSSVQIAGSLDALRDIEASIR